MANQTKTFFGDISPNSEEDKWEPRYRFRLHLSGIDIETLGFEVLELGPISALYQAGMKLYRGATPLSYMVRITTGPILGLIYEREIHVSLANDLRPDTFHCLKEGSRYLITGTDYPFPVWLAYFMTCHAPNLALPVLTN